MKVSCLITVVTIVGLLGACSKEEPPPHTVLEFMEDSILLEATMVRCARDRSRMKYESECVNAREAVNRIESREEVQRKKELEAQFERKRRALRRTQEAAAEARRRAADEQRRREEAEYLGLYETIPTETGEQAVPPRSAAQNNQPAAQTVQPTAQSTLSDDQTGSAIDPPAADSPEVPDASEAADDINSVREELKRRQDGNRN